MKNNMKNLVKFVFVLVLGLGVSVVSNAQCPTSLTSQADIDNFSTDYPHCTDIVNGLTITGTDITTLEGLEQLNSVGGGLTISNTSLTKLRGLNNLTSVGNLLIQGNSSLQNLKGLQSLNTVAGYLTIDNCPQLESIKPLNGLNSIGYWLILKNLPSLLTLEGLQNITEVGGKLRIRECHLISDLSYLSNLTEVGGDITIANNDNLSSLSGLDNINPSTIGDFYIGGNQNLSDCAVSSVCGYMSAGSGTLTVSNNTGDCADFGQVETACLLLPVDLVRFEVQAESGVNVLQWSTASEEDNLGFEIQRSNDGRTWEAIGYEFGAGTVNLLTEYRFEDNSPKKGKNYYRLLQEDFDGTSVYSEVRFVEILDDQVSFYPNPAQNELNFTNNFNGRVTVFSVTGAVELESMVSSRLDISMLKPGFYFVQIENQATAIRLIVQ